ncbi:MAG: anti-sigma regulatory factor [Clostridiales bacterium]|jgi:anti-sigma regulatory factor (Ser/Thr protein kinase)|nr:anti-sigma regulatory factor [Clostridiales bacterium]
MPPDSPAKRVNELDVECLSYKFEVDGNNFTSAGEASIQVKRILRRIGFTPETIKRASIAMYEGEINMVIHAGGGVAELFIYEDKIVIVLTDHGPGIADVALAMKEGYSTAPDNIRALGFGAGMGLPNMKRYTDSMEITTALGKGTVITMTVKV